MLPATRAAADKLIFDCANIAYIASLFDRKALERPVERLGWSVRQVFGHIALQLDWAADAVPKLLAADPNERGAVDWDALNAEFARKAEGMSLVEILETMARGRDRLIAQLLALSEADLNRKVLGETTLVDIIESWLPHMEEHALDLLDAEPALRRDPMVLGWILYADFPGRPDLNERVDQLYEEVREWAESESDEAEEDDDDS